MRASPTPLPQRRRSRAAAPGPRGAALRVCELPFPFRARSAPHEAYAGPAEPSPLCGYASGRPFARACQFPRSYHWDGAFQDPLVQASIAAEGRDCRDD